MASDRVDSAVGQHGGHERQVPAVHLHGALVGVEFNGFLHVCFDAALADHQIGECPVHIVRLASGSQGFFAELDGVSHVQGEHFLQAVDPVLEPVAVDQTGRGHGADVDHGIETSLAHLFMTDHVVEGVAGGLHAGFSANVLLAMVFQRQAVHERFGYGLHGKFRAKVPGRTGGAIDGNGGYGKRGRVRVVGSKRDVRNRPFGQRKIFVVQSLQKINERVVKAVGSVCIFHLMSRVSSFRLRSLIVTQIARRPLVRRRGRRDHSVGRSLDKLPSLLVGPIPILPVRIFFIFVGKWSWHLFFPLCFSALFLGRFVYNPVSNLVLIPENATCANGING